MWNFLRIFTMTPKRPSGVILLIGSFIALASLYGCTEKKVEVTLRIEVKTNQGDAVADAAVKLDGELIGQSDTNGQLAVKLQLPSKARKKIEVTKQSDKYYFAPFFESFVVPEVGKEQSVTATLFFVPKPEADDNNASSPADGSTEVSASDKNGVTPPATETTTDTGSSAIVSDKQVEGVEDQGPYPKPQKPNKGPLAFTIYIAETKSENQTAPEKMIADALIFYGSEKSGDLKLACKTNSRGRCLVRFQERPEGPVSFVAKKSGYLTQSESVEIDEEGTLRMNLVRGETIDIFATTRTYNYLKGLPGVEVVIKGKSAGLTDAFGRLSYGFNGKHNELLTVALKSSEFLPESFETDFAVSGPMTLVRYFAPRVAPPVRVTLLKAQLGSNLSAADLAAFDGSLDQSIMASSRRHLFGMPSFIEFSSAEFGKSMKAAGLTLGQAAKKGWFDTDLKAAVDAVILPTISMSDRPMLELNLIDSKGVVLAAAREKLENIKDELAINRSMEVLAAKLVKAFPFEGAVVGKENKFITVNIGSASGRGLSIGDMAEVHGIQADARGKNQIQKRIAVVRVKDIFELTARCEVVSTEPRSLVSRGDLVVLRPRSAPAPLSSSVRVMVGQGTSAKPVAQANVYIDDFWAGATDDSGRMVIAAAKAAGSGRVFVTKLGYKPFSADINFSKPKRLDITMKHDAAYIRVDSKPTGSTVRIDGSVIGKTPITTPVAVSGGFTKIQIEGPPEYKKFEAILELDEGTLDLTGVNSVQLEQDLVSQAKKIVENKPDLALTKLAEIPTDHSDYLLGRYTAGEIYLSKLQEPVKAAEAFAVVTKNPAVAEFNDKRFIGAHINEGIALFFVAKNLQEKNLDSAKDHFLKAIEVFDRVAPQVRFVPKTEYSQAVHNVDYYRALSRHRLWSIGKDSVSLGEAYRAWRDYVEGAVKSVPVNSSTKPLADNAKIYYRQVQGSMLNQSKQ